MKHKYNISIYVPFKKSDEEQRMVYGYCTSESLDSQGEVILKEAIIKAWDKYMEYANVREMHQPSAVGVTKEYTHDENGTFIGVKVVDDKAWKFVQEGVYKGFSIGGRVVKQKKNIIEEIILSEISLVDRPANPDAKFSVTKVDDGLVDQLQLEANIFNMKKFIEIDGVKYHEDPENAGQPLKDESGELKVWTEEDQKVFDEENGEKKEEVVEDKDEEVATVEDKKDEDVGGGEGDGDGQKMATSEWAKKAEGAGIIAKDSNGVIMLADLLSHLEYIMYCFKDSERNVEALNGIQEVLMKAIADETKTKTDKSEKGGDLAKMFGSELAKAVAPLVEKMGNLEKTVGDLSKEIDAIKDTKVSKRPLGAKPVDKVIQNGENINKGSSSALEKKKELESITKEIDAFALEWGPKVQADPSLRDTFMSKSAELHGKMSKCKQELNELLADTGGL